HLETIFERWCPGSPDIAEALFSPRSRILRAPAGMTALVMAGAIEARSPLTWSANATDLHALLRAANERGPFVFVASGDAASEIRVYHALYPAETAGIVLANANGVDDAQDIP